ncbi:ADAMTS-like protein 2 isoform X5 [Phyllopteryx taeniolatus]|uniref:ADAMTS-like protein 2 isoform X5 n=1 Tax=Phyllopteryx taeniolatus TaxID=161469 RepID=UPI002AD1F756|nr:ADAMTS-like protein 2 isoform X5 [Phyllopteryx taeniolatus]
MHAHLRRRRQVTGETLPQTAKESCCIQGQHDVLRNLQEIPPVQRTRLSGQWPKLPGGAVLVLQLTALRWPQLPVETSLSGRLCAHLQQPVRPPLHYRRWPASADGSCARRHVLQVQQLPRRLRGRQSDAMAFSFHPTHSTSVESVRVTAAAAAESLETFAAGPPRSVWNQNGRTPYITYEYTVLRDSLPPMPPPPVYTGADSSVEAAPLPAHNASRYQQTPAGGRMEGPGGAAQQETNEVYEETAHIHCDTDTHYTEGNSSDTGSTANPVPADVPLDPEADAPNLIWRVLLEGRLSPEELLINISTNQLLEMEGDGLFSAGPGSPEPDGPLVLNQTLEFTLGRKRNDSSADIFYHNKTLHAAGRAGGRSNRTRGNSRLYQKNLKLSPADMYRWKLSSQEPCSMTCSIGVSKSFVTCIRYDGVEVHDMYCDALTRPEPVHDFCIGRECQPRWEASSWSECSRTCGEGFQFRQVRCWKMLSPGLDSSVYSDLCTMADLDRPVERRPCKSPACGPQWEVAEWTECTAKCGRRDQVTRDVRCSEESRPCDPMTKPAGVKNCTGPPCERHWTVSEWGPCSGPCPHGRMVRHVYCKAPEGRVVAEDQCPGDEKPLAVQPCGERDCPAHWLNQDWKKCNTTCGRGVKRRIVQCVGISGGKFLVFEEEACGADERPEDESTCFERPCFKWYTTPWSECTKTCGVGVRMRDVKCYQDRELVRGCDPLTKPVSKQTCSLQPCPTEPPDESCQDRPTTNCLLALKVNLCSHWYYSKACCHSCRALRSPVS